MTEDGHNHHPGLADLYQHEIDGTNDDSMTTALKVKIATVMAARTSYTVVGDDLKPMSATQMINLHDKLISANPLHASPMEHCAKAPTWDELMVPDADAHNSAFGNFKGWLQYRKMFSNENVTK